MRKDICIEIILICLIIIFQGFAGIHNLRSAEPSITGLFLDASLIATTVTVDASRLFDTTVKRVATPIGTTVSCTIDVEGVGPSEYGQHELHDVKVTVLEVVRGNKAWELIRAADASNRPPDTGFEYLLARIRFEYSTQSSQGDMPYTLNQGCFKLYSADNKEYAAPPVESPQPELIGKVFYSGSSYEGWVPFMATTNDKPFLFYTSGSVWFQL